MGCFEIRWPSEVTDHYFSSGCSSFPAYLLRSLYTHLRRKNTHSYYKNKNKNFPAMPALSIKHSRPPNYAELIALLIIAGMLYFIIMLPSMLGLT